MFKKLNAKGTLLLVFLIISIILSMTITTYANENRLTIVTTFTILEDYARNIAGSNADVRVLAAIGAEVHEWELSPRNFVDLEEADVVFYNGLNVEQWMGQVRSVVGANVPVIAVGEFCEYPTLPIITGDLAGDPDPHIWMDARGAISYVEVMRDTLMQLDPENAEIYQSNSDEYISKLTQLHYDLLEELSVISEENRTLITSEAAFIYLANAYGFFHDGIWGTNTEEEGTPQQMVRILRIIQNRRPQGIFWESTGSDRYALSVSADTGIPIYGPLYVDSISQPGEMAETYIGLMQANAQLLIDVLAVD